MQRTWCSVQSAVKLETLTGAIMLHERTTVLNAFVGQQTPCQHLQARKYSGWSSVTPEQKGVEVGIRQGDYVACTEKEMFRVMYSSHH